MGPNSQKTESASSETEQDRQKDTQAIESLFGEHSRSLMAFLTSLTRNKELAESICQAVWTKVLQHFHQFDGRHFKGWLFRIARNEFASWGRIQVKRVFNSLDESHDVPVQASNTTAPERQEELDVMRDCMQKLSPRLLEIITRVKLKEESPEDVAVVIGTSRGQIDKDVHKAKKQLSDCMEKKLK